MFLGLQIEKLTPNAITPEKTRFGYLLFSAENKYIPALKTMNIRTDLSIRAPTGLTGRIIPYYSKLAVDDIMVYGTTIDTTNQRNIGILLYNLNIFDYEVKVGDKLAQIIFESKQIFDVIQYSLLNTVKEKKSLLILKR
jgi:dUTPase